MAGIRTTKRRYEARKKPIQERSRATVDALVTAAAQVFERRGYHAATTDLVAERAGTSVGTLYQYFPSKDALLVALFERHLGEIDEHFGTVRRELGAQGDLELIARRLVEGACAMHWAFPRLHRILLEDAPIPAGLLDRYAELERTLRDAWIGWLTGRVADPALVGAMVLRLLEAMVHRNTAFPLPPGDVERRREDLERHTAAMIVGYVRTQLTR